MRKNILRRIYGVCQVALISLLGCGICTAESRYDMDKANPVAPKGVVDTSSPTYEWKSVPGATRYCLTVSDLEGDPVYLAWYTAQEAACSDINGKCAVSPSGIIEGCQWAVIACVEGDCGNWSEWIVFEVPQSTCRSDRNIDTLQQEADSRLLTENDG